MKTHLAAFALVGATLVSAVDQAAAQSRPLPPEFLCGAAASKQRMIPGSQARRDFIQRCIAAANGPAPEIRPGKRPGTVIWQ